MSINDKIFDNVVSHMTDVRLYENGVQINNRRVLKRHRQSLKQLLTQDIRSDVSREVSRFGKELSAGLEGSMKEFSATQLDFHSDNLYKETRGFFKTSRPTHKQLLADITGGSMKGTPSLKGNVNNIAKGELVRIQQKVRKGLATGATHKSIIEDVLKTTKITEHQATTLTRTAITSTQTAAVSKVIDDNKDIIDGYVFTAILDSKTSPICSHHNGKKYDVDDKRYRPPLHFNCRSSMVPVLKSKEDILATDSTRIKKKEVEKIQPQRLNGLPPKRESYGAWLKRQAFDVQSKVLGGENEANIFRQGLLTVDQFTTSAGKALSLAALRRRAAQQTSVFTPKQNVRSQQARVEARTPAVLINNPKHKADLKTTVLLDATDYNSSLALTDFKGTSLVGKQSSRRRVGNVFDERNFSVDPFTGEVRNTLIYEPNHTLFQERIDFMRGSKLLTPEQKNWIEDFVTSLDDKVSLNQQTVLVENLRVVFERYAKDKKPWGDLTSVIRAEYRFAVQNTSRLLDTRSRDKSKLFMSYLSGKADESPRVQLMGKYYSFDEIRSTALQDKRYSDSWDKVYAGKLADKLYYQGRAPLRTYFLGLTDKYVDIKKTKENILDTIIPMRKQYLDFKKKWGEPSDSWWTSHKRGYSEAYRKLIDLEFIHKKALDKFKKNQTRHQQILAKAVRLVSEGKSTDYDSLAISIGEKLKEDLNDIVPGFTSTLKNKHKEGSKILNYMKEQGLIKVNLRGVTRRGVYDVETGRASSGWGDTISREVTVVDKSMLGLQEANRRLYIGRRIGTTTPRDQLHVRAGKKTFFDARGNDTGIPIISADKFPDYDAKQIDRDMANMMNHVSNVEYEVDNAFSGFMDDVVRFRDPRGNVAKYDDMNYFRKEILQRGEAGYGLMSTVKWHRQRNKPFKTGVLIDSRGRVYHTGYLTPTGGEMVRPFLNSHRAINFDMDAYDELKTQIGSMLGIDTEILTKAGRHTAFERNKAELLKLGELISSPTQRDRRIREFLEHPLIQHAGDEAAEIPKIARMALELHRLDKHLGGNYNDVDLMRSFKTKLMVENDASSSGAQIIGLSTRNREISELSNVLQTKQKQRLYDVIAQRTIDDPDFRKIASLREAGLTWRDLTKGAKNQNMVTFYGAGEATKTANVAKGVAKVLDKKGYYSVTKDTLAERLRVIDNQIKQSDKIGTFGVSADLKSFRTELIEVVNSGIPVSRKMLLESRNIHPDVEDFVDKLFNNRTGIVGPKDFEAISKIMSKYLESEVPVTGEFINFWKKAAKVYVTDTKKVDIPWVTFDGKVMMQRYRPPVQTRIDFTDPVTGRKISNIYQDSATDGAMKGKGDLASASIGLGVNGNHSNDAVLVRLFHLWGRKNKVDTGTIHDAFFTNIGDATKGRDALRNIYADALDGNTIQKTLKAMKGEGLSRKAYKELLEEARKRGLIDNPDGITKKEVLAPIKEGYDWYGIGP